MSTFYFGLRNEVDNHPNIDFKQLKKLYFSINLKHTNPNQVITKFKFLITFTHRVTHRQLKELRQKQGESRVLRLLGLEKKKNELERMSAAEISYLYSCADDQIVSNLNLHYVDYYGAQSGDRRREAVAPELTYRGGRIRSQCEEINLNKTNQHIVHRNIRNVKY